MSDRAVQAQPTQTPRTQRILITAAEIAVGMGHNYIGTEHLLLALVRDGDAIATQAIAKLVDPRKVETQVLEMISSKSYNTSSSQVVPGLARVVNSRPEDRR